MTIIDKMLAFSDAQAVTSLSSGSDQISTDVCDLGAKGKSGWGVAKDLNLGVGGKLWFNTQVVTVMVGAAAVITAKLVSKAANATISSGGTTHITQSFPALSAVGTIRATVVPIDAINRYIGTVYTASGAQLTSGAFDSFVSMSPADHDLV